MNGNKWVILAVACVSSLPTLVMADAGVAYTDRLIVKLRNLPATAQAMSGAQANRLSVAAGTPLAPLRAMANGAQVLKLQQAVTEAEAQKIAASLQQDASVEYAEPDRIMRASLVPNDPNYALQWNLSDTWGARLPAAWDKTTGLSSVVVAVLDSGTTPHAELSGRLLPGYDFISDAFVANDGDGRDADASDPGDWVTAADVIAQPLICGGVTPSNSIWHGTIIAGIIGAASNNSTGIAGIAWGPKILPVRVLGKCGGYLSDIFDAALWAAGLPVSNVPNNPNPANVLNLSLGAAVAGSCSITAQNVINQIVAAGKVIVVAAGNGNVDATNFSPANCSGVITVAATNRSGAKSVISSFGSVVAISAPGGDNVNGVYSLTNTGLTGPGADGYALYQGTSISTAHVSGIVALMLSANTLLTPAQVLTILQTTARPFPDASCSTATCGAGIIDAAAAVAQAGITPPPPPAPAAPASSGGGGGGGGGGCTLQPRAGFDPMLPALLMLGISYFILRRFMRRTSQIGA